MIDQELEHPSPERLAAFVAGRLTWADSAAVESHLADCERCCAVLALQPPDPLTVLLRAALEPSTHPGRHAIDASTPPAGNVATPPLKAASDAGKPTPPAIADEAPPPDLANHPHYRIVRRIGAGGMGAVYLAEQLSMGGRPVALKVINSALLDSPEAVVRFRREVSAAGKLDHPNVVAAYDAGQAGRTHFLVMQFIDGVTLEKLVEERGPLAVPVACEYVRQAAVGLQHAHDKGLVHRDLKPHNLILARHPDPAGEGDGIVKILDFGLAHVVTPNESSRAGGLTESGILLGTPDYMAPEQAADAAKVDIRADIYSLGCTLYFLLAGCPPFAECATRIEKLRAHERQQPEPLEKRRSEIPSELTRVVERMMNKDPARRYQTPAEVAEALTAIRTNSASPVAAPKRATRRRNIVAAGAIALAVLLGAGTLLFGPAVYRIATNQGELIIETDDPDVEVIVKRAGEQVTILDPKTRQSITLKAGEYELQLGKGKQSLKLSTDTFTLYRGDQKIVYVRRIPAGVARATPVEPIGEIRCFKGHAGPVHSVAFSPDGRHALSGGEDKTIRLWDLQSGKEIRQYEGSQHHVLTVAFSPDGSQIVSAGEDTFLRLWDTGTGKPIRTLRGHTDKIWRAVFSPDGKHILSGSEDGTIRLWDVKTGHQLECFTEHKGVVTSVAFCSRGRYALSGSLDKTIRLWDMELRTQVRVFPERPDEIWSVALSADGRSALSGGYNPTVLRLWDVNKGQELHQSQDHPHWIQCVAFSPDARYALSVSDHHTIHLWDCKNWHEIICLAGHTEHIWSVAFSPDGRFVLSGGTDGTVRLWRLPTAEKEFELIRSGLPPKEGLAVWSRDVIIRGSYHGPGDPLTAMNDGVLPRSSGDMEIPRMTWAPHEGTREWVSYLFAEPRQLSRAKVYWYDDTRKGHGCSVPVSWKLWARTTEGWQPLSLRPGSAYRTRLDQFNEVAFDPVTTRELKLEVNLRPNLSGGILEWTVSGP